MKTLDPLEFVMILFHSGSIFLVVRVLTRFGSHSRCTAGIHGRARMGIRSRDISWEDPTTAEMEGCRKTARPRVEENEAAILDQLEGNTSHFFCFGLRCHPIPPPLLGPPPAANTSSCVLVCHFGKIWRSGLSTRHVAFLCQT